MFKAPSLLLNDKIINTNKIFLQMASRRWLKIMTVAGSAALISGSYYGYTNYNRYMALKVGTQQNLSNMQISQLPDFKPTCRKDGPTKLNFDVTLFQYCSCPFCCKTRTFLDYFGIKYNIVEVDPVFRKKLGWSPYKKVPTVLVHSDPNDVTHGGKVYQINDSSVIISSLGSFLLSKRTLTDSNASPRNIDDLGNILVNYQAMEIDDGDGKKRSEIPNRYFLMLGDIENLELEKREHNLAEERRWRDWTDSVLVHSLSPNIYRSIPEAFQAFRTFSTMGQWDQHFTSIERGAAIYLGSSVMWLIGKKLKRKYNLKDDVRESLYDNCRLWLKAVGPDRKFMGGERPNLADLSVFGVLSSIEGCTAFNDLMANTGIGPWYSAVKESCKKHQGTEMISSI